MFLHNRAAACRRTGARLIALLAVVWSLGACSASNAFREHLYPAAPPSPSAIYADYQSYSNARDLIRKFTPEKPLSDDDVAKAYVTSGYDLAEKACLDFFVKVRQIRNDTAFAKDVIRNAMASAGLISALATAPTSVLAGLFGATGVAPSIIGDYEKIFLFVDAGDSLYPQVYGAMHSYRIKFPVNDADKVNFYTADMRVRQHATMCSLPYLTFLLKTAVKDVSITVTKPVKTTDAKGILETPKASEAKPTVIPFGEMEIK